ncbi:MAG: glycosyltransferase [Gammaproteobacteria bacterium]|nr:glycosyltransferase [Gammaproteobacteria bacterium]
MVGQHLLKDTLTGPRAWIVAALIFFFPATILIVDKAASASLILLAITGIIFGIRYPRQEPLSRDEKLLLFSVVFFFAVAVVAYLLSDFNYVGFKKLGRYLRFLLLIPIYLVVRRMPSGEGAWWTGICLGAVLAGIWGIYVVMQVDTGLYLSRVGGVTNPILFGDISLAMAFMSLGGINYFRRHGFVYMAIPITAFVLGNIASVLSGARGAWLAWPALILLLLFLAARRLHGWQRVLIVAGTVSLFVVAYLIPQTGVEPRVASLIKEFGLVWSGLPGLGSIGLRSQMWQVAWDLFLENPVFGAGVGGYIAGVRYLVESGELHELFLRYNHPHSEYFSILASRGTIGMIALFMLFGIPLRHFLWAVRHPEASIRQLAFAGIVLIVGYIHFALTEAIFDRTMPITFYVFCLAVIYGLLRSKELIYLRTPVPRKQSLSVTIIAKNEEDRIRECLESVKGWADEIIVLDSGSIDRTVEIVKEYTDKVRVTDWPGFGKQKQRALEDASCNWVLSLDADEWVSPELKCEIDKELQEKPRFAGYYLPRPMRIFGKQIDFGGSWQAPLRLFRRDVARFTDVPVHEKVVLERGATGRLRGGLFHTTYRDYGHAVQKFAEYAWLQANVRYNKGRRSGLTSAIVRGVWNFIYNYFIRFGFLDGARGFALAALHAQYTYNKYASLWALSKPGCAPITEENGIKEKLAEYEDY